MMKFFKYTLTILCALVAFQVNAEDGVSRSSFTSAIDKHEPTDEITSLDTTASKIYYFTEIKGLKGKTITHRWEQNGQVQANVTFNIGGNRWRVWSSKNLQPELSGQWQVMVVDEAGNVLSQNSFNYGEAVTAPAETVSEATESETKQAPATNTATTEKAAAEPATTTIPDEQLSKITPAAGGEAAPATGN